MRLDIGTASTTHTDRHGERFAKRALEGMVEDIGKKYIPYRKNHDPNHHVGVVLCGKVLPLSDGEFGLFVVAAEFENEDERRAFPLGAPNSAWDEYYHYLDDAEKGFQPYTLSEDEIERVDRNNLAAVLERQLDTTEVSPEGLVYKIKKYIASAGELRLEMHPQDHDPPHFHVTSKQRKIIAKFRVDDLELIREKDTKISRKDVKKIQSLAEDPHFMRKLSDEYIKLQ